MYVYFKKLFAIYFLWLKNYFNFVSYIHSHVIYAIENEVYIRYYRINETHSNYTQSRIELERNAINYSSDLPYASFAFTVRLTINGTLMIAHSRQARKSATRIHIQPWCVYLFRKRIFLKKIPFSEWHSKCTHTAPFRKESLSKLNESRTIAYYGSYDSFHCAPLERAWMGTIVRVTNFLVTTRLDIVSLALESRACTLSAAKFRSIATRIWIFSLNIVRRLRKLRINGPYFPLSVILVIFSTRPTCVCTCARMYRRT